MSDYHERNPIDAKGGILQKAHSPDGVLGLEFGSSAVKLIELSTTGQGYRIQSMAYVSLPVDAVVDSVIIDEAAVLKALNQALEESGTQATEAAILLRGSGTCIGRKNLPRMSRHELESTIESLMAEMIPYEMSAVLSAYRIGKSDASDQMEITAIAFPRNNVETPVEVVRAAGLTAKYLVSESSCLGMAGRNRNRQNLVAVANPEEKESVDMLLHLGGNTSHYVISKPGRFVTRRWGMYAGNLLTREIMQAQSCSYDEAERIKKENFSSIEPAAVDAFYDQLISHFRVELDVFYYRYPDYIVRTLQLNGGCVLIPGLVEMFQKELDVEVFAVNPFEDIEIPADRFERDEFMRIAPMMVSVSGATLGHDIDLAGEKLTGERY